MKKILILSSLIGLAMLLPSASVSFAETTSSVQVSFTIPVMPGINAPLLEQTKTLNPAPVVAGQNVQPQKQTQEPAPALIQTEKQEEKISDKSETRQVIVKTLYSR